MSRPSGQDGEVHQHGDIADLQDSFSKQQKKISALKELVKKSEAAHGKSTSSAQEKVKNIAQRLTLLKSKAKTRQAPNIAKTEISVDHEPEQPPLAVQQPQSSNVLSSTPNPTPPRSFEGNASGSEKILLLRQQMEQNRALMAQRASSKQHLEQLVTQLKEKFDTTQQSLEDTTELGRSMGDLSILAQTPVSRGERHRSATDLLSSQPAFSLERERIKFLENRCRLLEKQLDKERQGNTSSRDSSFQDNSAQSLKRVKELENKMLELEQVLKEKEQEIETKQDIELKLSKEIDLLRNTRNEDSTSEITNDSELIESLRSEIETHLQRIAELENVNDILATSNEDLSSKCNNFKQVLQEKDDELLTANENIDRIKEELEKAEQQTAALQSELDNLDKKPASSPTLSDALNTDSQVKAEMAKQIQELQDELLQLRGENAQLQNTIKEREQVEVSDASIAEKIASLESTIESQRQDLQTRLEANSQLEEKLMEKTIEADVANANFKVLEEKLQGSSKSKPLFSVSESDSAANVELQTEIQDLKQKLDDSNKAMIKLKLKAKQTEKQMEKLKKSSELHAEVIRLEKLNDELQQKLTELEDEKGQWQLSLVDEDDSAHWKEANSENEKLSELENKCKEQTETISRLEKQIDEKEEAFVSVHREMEELRQSIVQQHNDERVKTEMSGIQLEEQLELKQKQVDDLKERLRNAETDLDEHKKQLNELKQQKQDVDKKLEHYVAENMELMDKMSKVSKSSSSAESIEIVERLTNQERAEMDELTKRLDGVTIRDSEVLETPIHSVNELTQTEMGTELSESLVKLREESSELMKKIELFTTERREVLEKMENLTAENNVLLKRYEEVLQQKEQLEAKGVLAEGAKLKLELKLQEMTKEKELLALQVAESSAQKSQLSQELTSMQKSSEVVAALDCADGASLFDKCEKSLAKLNSELETYRKANDKNAKINASKKLAKEAKNAYTQLSELLMKVKEASSAVETVTVVETVVAVTAPNGKALAEYEQLTMQNRELKARIEDLLQELQSMREEMADMESTTAGQPVAVPALTSDPMTAIVDAEKLREALQKVSEYEEQVQQLETVVAALRKELQESNDVIAERSGEATRQAEEIASLKKLSAEFDEAMGDSKASFEQQIEQLTRLRLELEAKCETYMGEMEILQTLVAEQKQQLIEVYKENEHEMNLKLLVLQERDQQIAELKSELQEVRQTTQNQGLEVSESLQRECDKLRESLKISKALVTEQINELSNKQETIDTLNQQLIDLYKSMEQNANAVIEKEDEIVYLQELLETNKKEMDRLQKDNNQQKEVVDKLLIELHNHKANTEQLPQLESDLKNLNTVKKDLEAANEELQRRNKDQLDKLKKYAANLKKRTTHCLELEAKLKNFENKESAEGDSKKNAESLKDLSEKLAESEGLVTELQDALHNKTSEWLEANEKVESLELTVESLRKEFEVKREEVVQLQNALAASQESAQSDWGTFDDKSPIDDLMEVNTKLLQLESDWKLSQEECLKKDAKIRDLENVMEANEVAMADLQGQLHQLRDLAREREQACKELEDEKSQKKAEIENLSKQLAATGENENASKDQRIAELTEELKTKSLKFEKSKAVIKERNNQIHRLQTQVKDLQDKLSAQPEEVTEIAAPLTQAPLGSAAPASVTKEEYESLKTAYDKLSEQYEVEKSSFVETINRLETLHDGIQAKLQEDMSYIETLEQENTKFKEKICKLEECVGTFEERRASMERRVNLLDAQMQTRANEYVTKEDELVYRLNMLADHDDLIGQRLLSSQEEKDEMQERFDRLLRDFHELQTKHAQLEKEFDGYKEDVAVNLEQESNSLREQLSASEKELQHVRSVYDAKLAAKTTELDELECELSDQMEKMNAEKRSIAEALEKSQDECSELKDEIVRLKENFNALEQAKHELDRETTWLRMQNESSQQDQYDMQELRMQTMQDKTEIDNLRSQIDTLAANHDIELQALRTQITELDSLRMQVGQNQTDDQVFIETENKRLTDLLAEKDALIENYQRQLANAPSVGATHQPPATATNAQPVDIFAATFGLAPSNPSGNDSHEHLERELAEKTELNATLQRDVSRLQSELQSVIEGNAEMQRLLVEKNREIESLRASSQHSLPQSSQSVGDVVLPAPPMFFTGDQMAHSPFDDIVQVRVNESALEAVVPPPVAAPVMHGNLPDDMNEQPTIEDLQRNVSDLEKHAQDLENKLAARNQRECDFDERLYEMQAQLLEAEARLRDREQQMQMLEARIRQMEEISAKSEQDRVMAQRNLEETQLQLSRAESELQLRAEQLKSMELQLQPAQDNKVAELEKAVNELRVMLDDRDKLVDELQLAVRRSGQQQQGPSSVEAQIIEEPVLEEFKPTLDMFFGAPSTDAFDGFVIPKVSEEPVHEEIIVPKKAYVCQPEGDGIAVVPALNLTDSWGDEGWGEIDAEAESKHFETKVSVSATGAAPSTSLVSRTQQLEIQLEEHEEKLKELQKSLEQSEQQKQELQTKSGKIMKKLKEYKTKIDELQSAASASAFKKSTSVDSTNMFDDLDAAIQEELKSQIKKLEEKLSEQLKLQETFGLEKEKLLKRIDVLTAGNDRMSEMKERQDMEVQMYQTRIKELQSKLLSLEDWGEESGGAEPQKTASLTTTPTTQQTVEEIPIEERAPLESQQRKSEDDSTSAKLSELLAENQELQALVEEEKANVARAEELVRNLQNQITAFNNSTATLESAEKAKYNDLLYQYQNLEGRNNELLDANTKLSQQVEDCEKRLQDLQQQLEASESQCGTLQSDLLTLRTQLAELMQAKQDAQQLDERFRQMAAENDFLKIQLQQQQQQQANAAAPCSDELAALLQERDAEIVHLKQRIEDLMREDQTEKLVLEILTKNQEIAMLKMTVKNLEDDKQEMEHNLSLQITKQMQAEKGDGQKSNESEIAELSQQISKLEAVNKDLENEKKSMEEELQVLNNHVLSSIEMEDKMKSTVLELDMKNIEIAELRKSLETFIASNNAPVPASTTPPPQTVDVAAINAQWELVVEQKCGEIAEMWRAHLDVRERDFKAGETRLKEEITALKRALDGNALQHEAIIGDTSAPSTTASEATTDTGSPLSSNVPSNDGTPLRTRMVIGENDANAADDMIEKMQAALESQEMEIVSLKEQLAIRSAEYARLAAQYDPFQLQSAAVPTPIKRTQPSENASLVPKSELDLALYMLHQRDMRCEEMTHEIVSLLEERDTLQLKLSNTLRQVETIKTNNHTGDASSSSSEALPIGETVSPAVPDDSSDELSQKLSQLQTVNHSKDKVIIEEREQRIRQMERIQQDVAKIPPAAVSELVGTDLSHSNQSPSSVLLNWLWGNQGNAASSSTGTPQ